MGKQKKDKIKVGEWKKAPQCCPPTCCLPCCKPQCKPKCDYKQDLIVIEDGCVQACEARSDEYVYEEEYEDEEDENYHIEICDTAAGGNIHMAHMFPNGVDLLADEGAYVVQPAVTVPADGNLLTISTDPGKYDEIASKTEIN